MSDFNAQFYTIPISFQTLSLTFTQVPPPTDPVVGTLIAELPSYASIAGEGQANPQRKPVYGAAIGGYLDWFLERFWIDPVPIAFGNIIGEKTAEVRVLSTHADQRSLQSIDVSRLGGGITITDGAPPFDLPFMGVGDIEFTADIEGANSFSANIDFNYDGETVQVLATGRRLVLFWYPPSTELRENLSFFTDINTNITGKEQRNALRTSPRQRFDFEITQRDGNEATQMRNLLIAFRGFEFGVPVWDEQAEVTSAESSGGLTLQVSTLFIDHRVGANIVIWEPLSRTFQTLEIASFTNTSITVTEAFAPFTDRAQILPVRRATMVRNPSTRDQAFGALSTRISWETRDNIDLGYANAAAAVADGFTGHPESGLIVLVEDNLLQGSHNRTISARINTDRNPVGLPIVRQQSDVGNISGRVEVDLFDLADIRRYRQLVGYFRGSWQAFYLPTFRHDMTPTIAFNLDATSFTVMNSGSLTFFRLREPHNTLLLTLDDGRQFIAEVSSLVESGGNEIVSLVSAFGATSETVEPEQVRLSWCELTRIDGDSVSIVHHEVGFATMQFQTLTVQR